MKNLHLSTPIKTMLAAGGIAVVISGGFIVANALETDDSIDANKAKNIALKDSGVKSEEAIFDKAQLEKEDGHAVYEVKFHTGAEQYEYTIASSNGSILDRDVEHYKKPVSTKTDASAISMGVAKTKALQNAGLQVSDVTFTKVTRDKSDGKDIYEIQFKKGQESYTYKVLAKDGSIVKKDTKNVKQASSSKNEAVTSATEEGKQPSNSNGNNENGYTNSGNTETAGGGASQATISVETAKANALADAGVNAGDVTFIKVKLDYEHGVRVYEVAFRSATTKYEYDINAGNGAVQKRESKQLKNQQPPANVSYIGEESAKNVAFQHAGVNAGDGIMKKVKLDHEHGTMVYEVEFYQGNTKFEYTIDATTGAIVKWEKEQHNY